MLKICLTALFLIFALAESGINTRDDLIKKSKAECFAKSQIRRVIMEALGEDGIINLNFFPSYLNLRNGGIHDIEAIVRTNDSIPIERTCWTLAHYLPVGFNGTVWLSVESNTRLWSLNIEDRIPFLENLTQTCTQHGLAVGIYSDVVSWRRVMGNQLAGSNKLRALPLLYFNENDARNFNDFSYSTFGGWNKPIQKEYKRGYYLCDFYCEGLVFY